jgi:hypothetical protein
MYDYRKMTPAQRREAVEYRRLRESGTIVLIEASSPTGISGLALTTFITTLCITAMSRNGRTGRGLVQEISLTVWDVRLLIRFGMNIQFSITGKGGTTN